MPMVTALSQRTMSRLILIQSVLVGLQTVAAASILGDVIGQKYAALFIVLVAGAQQGVNYYLNKSVGETVAHVEHVVNRAQEVTEQAAAANMEVTSTLAGIISEQQGGKS